METKFVPLLFAGDINVYSMSRAFYEAYGIKPFAYGKYAAMPCYGSQIIRYTANPKADEQDTFLQLVIDFANEHSDEKVLLLGCGDSYVRLISANKGKYPDNVIAPYIDVDLMDSLINKEYFYNLCEKMGVDYPDTFIYRKEMGDDFTLPFDGPFIIKPSNGIAYWEHPYPTQKKVYEEKTIDDVHRVLHDIYDAGYPDSVIIQNCIPGDDTYMRVITNYSDMNGKVKMMCLGHVLLEEHTPHGLGNHAVIITEHNEQIENQIRNLLEGLHYVGFSNFDIKYDKRDGKYKVFEINTRQGRSNYYVTGAGANLARIVTENCVFEKELDEFVVTNENLWMVVPKGVAFKYIPGEEYKAKMKKLLSEGKVCNPLLCKADNAFGRKLKLTKNLLGHYYKYAKYYDLKSK